MEINGIININKEKNITSFDVVRKIKKITGVSKVGHTGTLDPLATGVLVICLGKFTRLSQYLMGFDKTYEVKMLLGFATDTYDLEGKLIDKSNDKLPTEEQFREVLPQFIGNIEQIPPMYSAVKFEGRKLYDYARQGEKIQIKPRKIFIESIENIKYKKSTYKDLAVTEASFKVSCSKGTYIRSLCFDIGKELSVPAVMSDLERTANGIFDISESYSINEVEKAMEKGNIIDLLKDPFQALEMKTIYLDKNQTEYYMSGKILMCPENEIGEYLVKNNDNILIGIGSVGSDGGLKSRKRLI